MATIKTSGSYRIEKTRDNDSVYNPDFLRKQSRWIRDDLDPQVARDGPDALHSDDILTLDEFLRRLLTSKVQLEDIRHSRLHSAILAICGQATRWPKKLIERADSLSIAWEVEYGPLKNITPVLYEPGGRLHGVCKPEDTSKEKLLVKWLKAPGVKISPLTARRVGNLGFRPGDWWISALFAFKDGIIDSGEAAGGIISDAEGAYAVLMTGDEEISAASTYVFTYRAPDHDRGRYRLAAATRESRQPVRILRAHSLRSFYAPKTGVRYDGLHTVIGWSITMKNQKMVYDIQFKRLSGEPSMDVVLRRPFSDEIEDYREYKRIRQDMKLNQQVSKSKGKAMGPTVTFSSDGAQEDMDGYFSDLEDGGSADSAMADELDEGGVSIGEVEASIPYGAAGR